MQNHILTLSGRSSNVPVASAAAPRTARRPAAAPTPTEPRPAEATADGRGRKSGQTGPKLPCSRRSALRRARPGGPRRKSQELALLIETYRALGETKKAVRHMENFVARYPTARQNTAVSAVHDEARRVIGPSGVQRSSHRAEH